MQNSTVRLFLVATYDWFLRLNVEPQGPENIPVLAIVWLHFRTWFLLSDSWAWIKVHVNLIKASTIVDFILKASTMKIIWTTHLIIKSSTDLHLVLMQPWHCADFILGKLVYAAIASIIIYSAFPSFLPSSPPFFPLLYPDQGMDQAFQASSLVW